MWVVFNDAEGREVWVKVCHIAAVETVDNDLGAVYVSIRDIPMAGGPRTART